MQPVPSNLSTRASLDVTTTCTSPRSTSPVSCRRLDVTSRKRSSDATHDRRSKISSSAGRRMTSSTIMLVGISVVFLITTAPSAVFFLASNYWLQDEGNGTDAKASVSLRLFFTITNIIYYMNNATNFLLYCLIGSKFRRALADTFRVKCAWCGGEVRRVRDCWRGSRWERVFGGLGREQKGGRARVRGREGGGGGNLGEIVEIGMDQVGNRIRNGTCFSTVHQIAFELKDCNYSDLRSREIGVGRRHTSRSVNKSNSFGYLSENLGECPPLIYHLEKRRNSEQHLPQTIAPFY